jgi:hypothetical protein
MERLTTANSVADTPHGTSRVFPALKQENTRPAANFWNDMGHIDMGHNRTPAKPQNNIAPLRAKEKYNAKLN